MNLREINLSLLLNPYREFMLRISVNLMLVQGQFSPRQFSPDSSVRVNSVRDNSVLRQFSPRQFSPETIQSQKFQSQKIQSETVQSRDNSVPNNSVLNLQSLWAISFSFDQLPFLDQLQFLWANYLQFQSATILRSFLDQLPFLSYLVSVSISYRFWISYIFYEPISFNFDQLPFKDQLPF